MKNLTWQNPEQLFVAQELINKVKSKCCGIKDKKEGLCLVVSSFYLIFAVETKMMIMKSKEYYISLILSHAEELKKNFGVKSLRLFGSVSRNEQKEGSDVDICVDMEPKMFLVVRLKRFLENLLECSVDIVRMHKHINPFLLKEIEHDGIYIIK